MLTNFLGLTTNQEVPGSTPGKFIFFWFLFDFWKIDTGQCSRYNSRNARSSYESLFYLSGYYSNKVVIYNGPTGLYHIIALIMRGDSPYQDYLIDKMQPIRGSALRRTRSLEVLHMK